MNTDPEVARLQDQLEQLQHQLLRAQRLTSVGELASSITHEFNNVLTTVINYAKLGLRHQDAESRTKAFEKILAAGQRASRITTGLLAYSRRGTERREATDLGVLIRDVLLLVEKDLEHHRVRLETSLPAHPVCSAVNAGQIQQVVLNLVVNARQAMPQGGVLTVALAADVGQKIAEIRVQDTGTGIAPEHLSKLFQPFFTTKQADEKGQGGNGLGLSLCQDVIQSHGGAIRVQSDLGRGTRFLVTLPLESLSAPLSPAAAVLQQRAQQLPTPAAASPANPPAPKTPALTTEKRPRPLRTLSKKGGE
ncbi:MAG: sensor histidine kinase [Planctomycetaceae bacterium]|jgi:signal transduction histidine kinase